MWKPEHPGAVDRYPIKSCGHQAEPDVAGPALFQTSRWREAVGPIPAVLHAAQPRNGYPGLKPSERAGSDRIDAQHRLIRR
jgi:hypothetical protein